jgi:peptidoglycan/LPS O-acetylase OafA/YrhL
LRHHQFAIYLLTPFRIDGIALGSMLALLLEQRSWQEKLTKWSGVGAAVAFAVYLVLWTVLGHGQFSPFAFRPIFNLIGYSLVAVIAFFLIAYARLRPEAIFTRFLRNRLLVKLGVISYGVYIYSWMFMVAIEHRFTGLSEVQAGVLQIFVSIPASAFIFKYYERPISVWGRRVAARLTAKANIAIKDGFPDPKKHGFEIKERKHASIVATYEN